MKNYAELLRERIAKIPKEGLIADHAVEMFKVIEDTACEFINDLKNRTT
jgi:hypothetical protein